ncbi:MAG: threonine--tRNA ligase [Candidatus ainarchaeum sp.]|nr:threonine--tRNA ligase [Candidatus ainarchaeum sp.]
MRILTIHADYMEVEALKKAIDSAESVEKGKKRFEEVLVVFTAVEQGDENIEESSEILKKAVVEVAHQVKTNNILLYPLVHLTSKPSSPQIALEVIKKTEELLNSEEFSVERSPFGWYKGYTLKCKGHPLSELSRELKTSAGKTTESKEESKALKAEKKLKSYFYILSTDGKLDEISYEKEKKKFVGFDFGKYNNLKKFAAYELAKDRVASEDPPHVKLMRKLELVDYEPASDPGNLRYYPKGRFIKSQIERYVTQIVKENGGMEIETPIMYDFEHPALKSYLNRFPARQYSIETPNKKVFLRFAACFGGFIMAHDANISYKQLPLWIYELTKYSFRVEQRGELTGLRRLRTFTMPDCHAFCSDEEQAKSEVLRRFEMSRELQKNMGLEPKEDLELAIRATKEFYEKNKKFIHDLVKNWGKPALLEMWEEQFFYFVFKYELNFVDNLGKCSALTTDQIDIENAKRYGIEYVDEKGEKKNPLTLHLSPSGAVERIIYALLEKAALQQKQGKIPSLPLWLSPTQIRLVPVSNEKHLEYCKELAKKLSKENIRVDIDDREEGVGKKIRTAGQDWTPYIIVIGDEELKNKEEINVRERETNQELKMPILQLISKIKEKTNGMPYDTLPLPRELSKRIIFVG